MNLRDLLAVQALVTTGTTKGAAVNIGVSQPTVSRAVMEMEANFGRQLFARQHGRLVPTAAALRIGRSAAEIDTILRALRKDLDQASAELVLRVGMSPCHSSSLIHQAVRRLSALQPATTLKLFLFPEAELERALADGEIDVALSTRAHPAADVELEHLLSLGLCCILPAGHRLAEQDVVTPAMLESEAVVGVRTNESQTRQVQAAFREAGVPINERLEVASLSMACEFVSSGMGIVFCTAFDLNERQGVIARPFAPAIECRLFSMVRTTGPMLQAARQFCRLIRLTKKAGDAARPAPARRLSLQPVGV